MLNSSEIQSFFFLGIGGIGMSALARYFSSRGFRVAGYDRTPSNLTHELEQEGIAITYEDTVASAQALYEDTMPGAKHLQIVYTPAIPKDSVLMNYFVGAGYDLAKRSEVLGFVTRHMQALCVAGTHGKTTTSTMLAHIMHQSSVDTNAFLGGISNNYQSNLVLCPESSYVVVEADEYDRSFHRLTPYMTVITSCDPDHLDIYGTEEAYRESFEHYTSLVSGAIIMKHGLTIQPQLRKGCKLYTYGVFSSPLPVEGAGEVSFYADNISVEKGQIYFDFHTPTETIARMRLGVPVWINIENAVAAMAVAWLNGVSDTELRTGLASYSGVYRRFNIHVQNERVAYIDDYAHHPEELRQSVDSIRRLYPERYQIGIFQPHLYTRTRDFADQFAESLSLLDEVILLPIYPARELPIEGVSSEMLLDRITTRKSLVEKADLVNVLKEKVSERLNPLNLASLKAGVAVLSLGAGDIDRLVPELKEALKGV